MATVSQADPRAIPGPTHPDTSAFVFHQTPGGLVVTCLSCGATCCCDDETDAHDAARVHLCAEWT